MLMLAACGGSSRPEYYGHEESTAGVPGWSPDGKRKLAPNVKLGKPYRVNGVEYVPKYQPNYNEVGKASWYGPGFHGGKTANGEQFSTHDMTAAHTTLPLPSIVRVTNLRNNKSAIVRINDRGPFARGRIIDLSKAAAEEIDMIGEGIGTVRVEYMPAESEKFMELLASGRSPGSIDLASEVIGKTASTTQYANIEPEDNSVQVADTMPPPAQPAGTNPSVWQRVSPVSNAYADPAPPTVPAPASQEIAVEADPTDPFQFAQAPPPSTAPAPAPDAMPPAELPPQSQAPAPITTALPPSAPVTATSGMAAPGTLPENPVLPPGIYLQLGTFSQRTNAEHLREKGADYTPTYILTGQGPNDAIMYRVRMGPFVNRDAAEEMLERLREMGIADAKIFTQ